MLDKLKEAEKFIMENINNLEWIASLNSLFIDYEHPYVERLWFQFGDYRVYMHRIHRCGEEIKLLFHKHPWKSAIRIVKGSYEMGVGHNRGNKIPPIDCKLILNSGNSYEMTEDDGWHYVKPITEFVSSIMITGELSKREMPVKPQKELRPLTEDEKPEIIKSIRMWLPVIIRNYH